LTGETGQDGRQDWHGGPAGDEALAIAEAVFAAGDLTDEHVAPTGEPIGVAESARVNRIPRTASSSR
jgi:hypothetical protein